MGLSKEELFQRIHADSRQDGMTIRALALKHGCGRALVRQAIDSPVPPPRRTPVRGAPLLGPFHDTIDEWLRADLTAPAKQRHTVRRITDRLNTEFAAGVGYSTVRDYVAVRRRQIAAQAAGRVDQVEAVNGFVPRHNRPGEDAEVDFGEVWVRIAGQMTKCHLFVLRLSYSGRAVHRITESCGQEAFLEGHAHAFAVLGGIPAGVVRFDNLTPAVVKVVFRSRERVENARWTAFHLHYGFTPWYCEPGLRGAHEKGGVEGQVGYFRRNYLTPVPEVASLEELNTLIEKWEQVEDRRHIGVRENTIGQDFLAEAHLLRPLPEGGFETRLQLTPTVDRQSMITVRMCDYSVPARFIGRRVRVMLGSQDLIVYNGRTEIARHRRTVAFGAVTPVLDHYLEILVRKPGALAGSAPLEHARSSGAFTPVHEAYWSAAKNTLGEDAGTMALIEILLLHRHMSTDDVIAGMQAALAVGTVAPEIVTLEARKHAQLRGRAPTVTAPAFTNDPARAITARPGGPVRRRIEHLPADTRPAPDLSGYDLLLHRPALEEPCPSPDEP